MTDQRETDVPEDNQLLRYVIKGSQLLLILAIAGILAVLFTSGGCASPEAPKSTTSVSENNAVFCDEQTDKWCEGAEEYIRDCKVDSLLYCMYVLRNF